MARISKEAGGSAGAGPQVWVDAGDGYALALEGDKLVCRNAAGRVLASVPKAVRAGAVAERLVALQGWLEQHEAACTEAIEGWMLRSLPVPRAVLAAVRPDPTWQGALENLVAAPVGPDGVPDPSRAGFLKAVDAERGVGIVDLDGETRWLDVERIAIPHPILLEDLPDWRSLATELGFTQRVQQLFRETHARPADLDPEDTHVDRFSGGQFSRLIQALGICRKHGYRVRGGSAVCRVFERGQVVEARFWLGDEDPHYETETGDLNWVDEREHWLTIGEVGPVAYSEGMRMAAIIYAGRDPEESEADSEDEDA